ncbi:MAG: hypothetical protein PUA48_05560 [Christensenellaceae bacterium]|nr:hypothetical protein [Christensenellaceae bacterium]
MKKLKNLKLFLSVYLIAFVLISIAVTATACDEKKGPITDLGAVSVSATKSYSQSVSIISCEGYNFGNYPGAKVRVKCEKTGVYLISASSANVVSKDLWLNVQDVCENYTYTPTVPKDNMIQHFASEKKGDKRIFALRLKEGEFYYVKVFNTVAAKSTFSIKISYCNDKLAEKYSTRITNKSFNNKGKGVNTYDSKIWLNIIPKSETPTKKNGNSETVMIAWLNRDDVYSFYLLLNNIREITNADVKKQVKDVAWFIFSNTISVLEKSIIPEPVSKTIGYADTLKSIFDLVSGHFSLGNNNSTTILKTNFKDSYLKYTKLSNINVTRNIGTKVVINRTYNKYSITISNWDDTKKQELVAPKGNYGMFILLESLETSLKDKVFRIKQ